MSFSPEPPHVELYRWRDASGAPALTIACRASFALLPGRAPLAVTHAPLEDLREGPRPHVRMAGCAGPNGKRARLRVGGCVWCVTVAHGEVAGMEPLFEPHELAVEMREDAHIELERIHPHSELFRTQLPGAKPRGFVELDGSARPLWLSIDELFIDLSAELVTLTWRTSLPLPEETAVRVLLGIEEGGELIHPMTIYGPPPTARTSNHEITQTSSFDAPAPPLPPAFFGRIDMEATVDLPSWTSLPPPSPPPRRIVPALRHHAPALGLLEASDAAAQADLPAVATRSESPRRTVALDILWIEPGAGERWAELDGKNRRGAWSAPGAVHDDTAGLRAALADVADPPSLERSATCLRGTLQLEFDPLARLRALVALTEPLAPLAKKLGEVLARAQALSTSEWAHRQSVEATSVAILQALDKCTRAGIEQMAADLLLERRAFERRTVLGAPRLRTLLALARGTEVVLYLPEALADRLPLIPSFEVRAFVSVHPRQDHTETSEHALVALALARSMEDT